MNSIGSKIKERRKELKLSQNQLADEIGITQPFMAEIENGRKSPSLSTLEKLCNVLGFEFVDNLPKTNISGTNEKGEFVSRFSKKEALEIIKDVEGFPDEAIGELRSFIEYLNHKYDRGEPQ